ncbi:DUF1566 domain-containing protein [Pseudoalteromonas rubra]|uniref:Lcl C-terminal domain-containing protein n=1 Tax=Pseudoalteromonas rubra TaxID=43658 RepID=UPI0013DDC950|nr:DUF1566 domain-containing protein [Pseudoalteromonas rubra]
MRKFKAPLIISLMLLNAQKISANQVCNTHQVVDALRFNITNHLVYDNKTNLTWYSCRNYGKKNSSECVDYHAVKTWQEALKAVEGVTYAGYSDWRLPSIKELNSIIEYSCYYPALNLSLFPNQVINEDHLENTVWSSTPAISARLPSSKKNGVYVTNLLDGHSSVIPKSSQASYFMVRQGPVHSKPVERPLNDTGITMCADDLVNRLDCPVIGFEGQDAQYGRDALAAAGLLSKIGGGNAGFDFTKLDANGNDLPASSSKWSCVRDNHTGLIWEVKTDDGGLHDKDDRYSWYNPDRNTNGGSSGYQNIAGAICYGYDGSHKTTYCNTYAYVRRVNQQGLCGANDWRLPNNGELRSLVDYSVIHPAIDSGYFPHTQISLYWSSSPSARNDRHALCINFSSSGDNANFKGNIMHVRLVKASH